MLRLSRALLVGALLVQCGPTDAPPPSEPNADPTTSHDVVTFAIDTLMLGDRDRDGGASNNAWKLYGYDLDQRITTKQSTDVCTLQIGAPLENQIDGIGGVDNAWGSTVLFAVQFGLASPSPSDDVTSVIRSGAWTLLVQVTGLSGEPKQNALGLDAKVFVGGSTSAPTFDTSTDWPVTPGSLNDGATIASGARVHFNQVYVSNGTIVARDATEPLVLPMLVLIHDVSVTDGGVPKPPRPTPLTLRIHQPIMTFDTTGERGTIAGVLTAQEAFAQVTLLTDALFAPQCNIALAMVDQVGQAQDILDDGTNQAGVPCNAISIGLGFTAKRVANPTTVGADPPPQVDACDAGAD